MSESLGNAVLDLSTDGSGLEQGLDQAEGTTKSKLSSIGGLIGKATMAAGAAFAAAGGAAIAAAFKTAAYGDEVAKTATKLGTTTEGLQEMRLWADRNGISAQSMDRAVGRLNQRIGRAIDGNAKYAEAFADVDVAIQNADGSARSTNEVMADTISKLSQIEDPALQSARASEIFGTKMARDLMPALQEGSLSLEEAAEMAHELGVVMSGEDAAAAEAFTDSWANIKDAVGGFIRDAAIPVMKWLNDRIFPVILDGIKTVRGLWEAFQEGDGIVGGFQSMMASLGDGDLFGSILDAAKGLFGRLLDWLTSGGLASIVEWLMAARVRLFDAAMRMFPALIDAAVQFLPQLLDHLASTMIPQLLQLIVSQVPVLLDAALTLFTALIDAVLQVLPMLVSTLLGDVLPTVLTSILSMIPQLLNTAVEAFLALVDAILDVLPVLLETLLGDVLPNVLTTIIAMLPEILQAAISAFTALVIGLVDVLPTLLTTLLTIVLPALLETLVDMIPQLIDTAIVVFLALVDALIEVIPELVGTIATELVPALVDAVIDIGPKLFEAGKEIIRSLIDGIGSMVGAVGDAAGKIVGKVRDFLPFSPAREGPLRADPPDEAGATIAAMLAQGLEAGVGDVEASMNAMLAPAVDVDGPGGDGSEELIDAIWRLLHRDPAIVMSDGTLVGKIEDRLALGGAV